jgi:sugar phosphate permease
MQEPLSTPAAPGPASDAASPAVAVSERKRWTIVWLLFAASLINYFDRQTLAFALPLLAKDFDLDPVQQSRVLSTFFWTYTILQIRSVCVSTGLTCAGTPALCYLVCRQD